MIHAHRRDDDGSLWPAAGRGVRRAAFSDTSPPGFTNADDLKTPETLAKCVETLLKLWLSKLAAGSIHHSAIIWRPAGNHTFRDEFIAKQRAIPRRLLALPRALRVMNPDEVIMVFILSLIFANFAICKAETEYAALIGTRKHLSGCNAKRCGSAVLRDERPRGPLNKRDGPNQARNVVDDPSRQWWVADGRFGFARPFYGLRIAPILPEDSGIYRCRLETDPLFALTMSTAHVELAAPRPKKSPYG
ncbi:hypothetical protein ANCCEY_02797 [Ancylostoma ceylanicum]|uniref:Uncharacterized protein n=1 Tax=Ancylostoma ceylanicum TaxID=53326 RepID=A0A0D6MBZ3_9BILA|nr:hypothetical protein ANCCEY_02797 [Ancylostoma ceylanicum]